MKKLLALLALVLIGSFSVVSAADASKPGGPVADAKVISPNVVCSTCENGGYPRYTGSCTVYNNGARMGASGTVTGSDGYKYMLSYAQCGGFSPGLWAYYGFKQISLCCNLYTTYSVLVPGVVSD